jgi:DNA-directed RNA polymerase specialized sigma subunit
LAAVVDTVQPVINYHLGSLKVLDDPIMRTKARVLAAKAVKSYDPQYGAGLPTWVSQRMIELRRAKRLQSTPLKVPERIQQDAWTLAKAEREFMDQHDREPDMLELADFSKMPLTRVQHVRKTFRATPAEASVASVMGTSEMAAEDHSEEAAEYIYRESDYLDRKIMEWKTGYGGNKEMAPDLIARQLKISPAQVSRRAARLALRINKLEQDLRDIS